MVTRASSFNAKRSAAWRTTFAKLCIPGPVQILYDVATTSINPAPSQTNPFPTASRYGHRCARRGELSAVYLTTTPANANNKVPRANQKRTGIRTGVSGVSFLQRPGRQNSTADTIGTRETSKTEVAIVEPAIEMVLECLQYLKPTTASRRCLLSATAKETIVSSAVRDGFVAQQSTPEACPNGVRGGPPNVLLPVSMLSPWHIHVIRRAGTCNPRTRCVGKRES